MEGDDELQQAVRVGLFHVLQAGARAERRAIPAKGLTGPGYDGHAFWDTETYVLPALTYTRPDAAATRCAGGTPRWTWPATGRATSGCDGAAFPWRTIRGEETSGYWPAGTAAFHINADIADAVVRYQARARTRLRPRLRRGAAGRDGAAVGVARPLRRRTGRSASTG